MSKGYIDPELGLTMMLPGMGPNPGDTYRNVHTGLLCTVMQVQQRRHALITFRVDGRESSTYLRSFLQHWSPCRPDGTIR